MSVVKSLFIGLNSGTSIVPSTTAADYIDTLFTSEGVAASASTTEDDTYSTSRQPRGSVRTGISAQGPLEQRFRFGGSDHIFESALHSPDWEPVSGNVSATYKLTGTIQLNSTTKGIAATSGSPFADLAVGDWIRLEKSGYANDGLVCRISTWTDADNIVTDSWSQTLTNDGAPVASVVVRSGERLTISTTERVHTYVKKIGQAGTTLYEAIGGARFEAVGVSLQQGQLATVSSQIRAVKPFGEFDGNFIVDSNGDIAASGTTVDLVTYTTSPNYTAAPSTSVFSLTQTTRGAIMVDGTPSTQMVEFSWNLANNIRGESVLFYFGEKYVQPGRVALSGTANAIFDDAVLYTKFVNDTSARLASYIQDGDTNGYVFDMPNVKLGGGGTGLSGDDLVKIPFTYACEVDATTSRAFQLIRFDASL